MRIPPLALLRAGLISAALCVLAGCSADPATAALRVEVNLESTTVSRCVKVFAEDGTAMEEAQLEVTDRAKPLVVAIYADKFAGDVRVRAVGYRDEACSVAADEASETKEASFALKPTSVTLLVKALGQMKDGGFDPDAGTDAGMNEPDGGDDGGFDAGVDQDQDGVPLPADCDDTNPNVKPGAIESCTNGVDDDCDSATDCMDSACLNAACAGGGTCVGTSCMAPTEVSCSDGVDNDGDGRVDCLDPDCTVGATCNDSNACTTGERCVVDGGCEKTNDVACTTPPGNPQCYAMNGVGVCLPDAGTCSYTPTTNGCDDGDACTTGDTCADGGCTGTPVVCNAPPTSCFRPTGLCAQGACSYVPLDAGTGSCNDGNNCTTGDTCAGDGGCAGTPVTCTPPSECHQFAGTCQANGACDFEVRTGQPCAGGTCNAGAQCVPTPANLFPYAPSNFTEAQLPSDAGTNFTVTCDTTINTSGTPSITSGCGAVLPQYTLFTQTNGDSTMLIRVQNFTINSSQTLTITGTRPAIIAAVGTVTISGTLLARAGGNISAQCGGGGTGDDSGNGSGNGGGGGGGFGTAGAAGSTAGGGGAGTAGSANGVATLIPLRGGCRGGNGTSSGGNGGGGVQVSASGAITISGIVTAPGRGGTGATGSEGNSGGGGGSGGGILLEGTIVTLGAASRLTANGGGGGEGSGGGTGDNGNDGSFDTALQAFGGSGGSATGGNGGLGASSVGGPTSGNTGATQNDGSGGGGGGVGRIRINAMTSCTLSGTRIVSPAATSNGAAGCN